MNTSASFGGRCGVAPATAAQDWLRSASYLASSLDTFPCVGSGIGDGGLGGGRGRGRGGGGGDGGRGSSPPAIQLPGFSFDRLSIEPNALHVESKCVQATHTDDAEQSAQQALAFLTPVFGYPASLPHGLWIHELLWMSAHWMGCGIVRRDSGNRHSQLGTQSTG